VILLGVGGGLQTEHYMENFRTMSPNDNELIRKAFNTLAHRINQASSKHPKPSFAALVEEVGEVATEIQADMPEGSYRSELFDVATVAIRLILETYK